MNGIKTVVTGHGNFATGLKSSMELLAGPQEEITFIDFTESMSEGELGNLLKTEIGEDELLFFTDLAGGTPFKEAVQLSVDKSKVRVVTGCNLGSLLESRFTDYNDVDEYANELVKITQRTAELFSMDPIEDQSISEDGI